MTTRIEPQDRRRQRPFHVPAAVAGKTRNDERSRLAVAALCYATLLAILVTFLMADSALGQEPAPEAVAVEREGSVVLDQYPTRWAAEPEKRVRIPMERLANFDRLRRELSTEAAVEDLLEAGDRRDLVAVRAWVDRCGRVESCRLSDNPHDFNDGRDVLQQLAKESLREYVKQEVRWEALQDRAKVRVRNFFLGSRDRAEPTARGIADPARERSRFGTFELSPQADIDLDDTELGLDFGYDPVRYEFLSDWELSYRERVQQTGRSLRLRYSGEERWFDLTTAKDDDYRGDYVALTITQLF